MLFQIALRRQVGQLALRDEKGCVCSPCCISSKASLCLIRFIALCCLFHTMWSVECGTFKAVTVASFLVTACSQCRGGILSKYLIRLTIRTAEALVASTSYRRAFLLATVTMWADIILSSHSSSTLNCDSSVKFGGQISLHSRQASPAHTRGSSPAS